MKLLITGGAGFLGTSIIKHLIAHNPEIEITVLDNFSLQNYGLIHSGVLRNRNLTIVKADILDSRTVMDILS